MLSRTETRTHPLQNRNGEGGGFAGTRLSLSNAVTSTDDGHNSSLLDSRRSLEPIGVDSSQELWLQLHVVEAENSTHQYGLILRLGRWLTCR